MPRIGKHTDATLLAAAESAGRCEFQADF